MGLALSLGVMALVEASCISSNNVLPGGVDASLSPFTGDGAAPSETDAALAAEAAPTLPSGEGGGSCPAGWVASGGVCVLGLSGAWVPSTDANSDGPDTVATLGTVTSTSVSVIQSHTGTDSADCGCNAQHLNIPLGRSFDCATATLAFDYTTTAAVSADNTPAVDIRFCTGACPSIDGGIGGPYFYSGAQYVGSPFAPAAVSSCGYEWENDAGTGSLNSFPASAQIQTTKTNVIPLGTYAAPSSSDACTGSFDTIDVHMQVYNCTKAQTGTSTLSNLRIY